MAADITVHVVQVPVMRHRWVRHVVRSFESDPAVQYRIHMIATYFWIANFIAAVSCFLFLPRVWDRFSVLYLVVVSLYANFATDYGAVSAAEAAATGHAVVVEDSTPDHR